MKEILKNLQTGKTQIFEVPNPRISKGAGFDSTLNFSYFFRNRKDVGGFR